MSDTATLSLREARKLILLSQFNPKNNFSTKKDKYHLYGIIENLGYVQIDTISIVERSHHHILWTRTNSYRRTMLDELVEKDKMIFQYWSHAAAYLPMKDYRYSLIRKNLFIKKHKQWGKANKKITNLVYDRIKSEGPLQSRDFKDYREKTSGWWDWKPSKDALDFLFHQGKLMIPGRKGFQKVYDLTERVLPQDVDISYPSEEEFYEYLISSAIRSNGFVSAKEITYLRTLNKKLFGKVINKLNEDKKILKINLKGFDKENYYTSKAKLNLLDDKNENKRIYILSPFDNLIIQRKRLKDLFGFEYQVECYVPEAKRKFGYFCLPVIYGDKFICKIDTKADRDSGTFVVKKIFWEDKFKNKTALELKFSKKLSEIAKFTGCPEVIYS